MFDLSKKSWGVMGASRIFCVGHKWASERRRREDRGAEGAEGGRVWEGVSPPQPTRGSGERRELPQRDPGRSPGRKRKSIF